MIDKPDQDHFGATHLVKFCSLQGWASGNVLYCMHAAPADCPMFCTPPWLIAHQAAIEFNYLMKLIHHSALICVFLLFFFPCSTSLQLEDGAARFRVTVSSIKQNSLLFIFLLNLLTIKAACWIFQEAFLFWNFVLVYLRKKVPLQEFA